MSQLLSSYYSSPRWSHELIDCAMPVTLDTYSNCSHGCTYCFAAFRRAIGSTAEDYLRGNVKAVDFKKIERLFRGQSPEDTFHWYISNRYVVQWGGLSDAFDFYEREHGVSLRLLRLFNELEYPISISTKATWFLSDPEYAAEFTNRPHIHLKTSIVTTDEALAARLEPNVPSPSERLEALARAKELGVGAVSVRFRPFILGASDLCMEDVVNRVRQVGATGITTEFLCIERRSAEQQKERYRAISEAVGYDVLDFYIAHTNPPSGLLRLNYELKRPYLDKLEALCRAAGLHFWVSDAHGKERCDSVNCCGLPNMEGPLGNSWRGTFTEALVIARQKGRVRWGDIAPYANPLKGVKFNLASGFNTANTRTRAKGQYWTMLDYVRYLWNTTSSGQSPSRYFGGVLIPARRDEAGDVEYWFNYPLVERGVHIKTLNELADELEGRGLLPTTAAQSGLQGSRATTAASG